MLHHIFNCKSKVQLGFALYATIRRLSKIWLSMSEYHPSVSRSNQADCYTRYVKDILKKTSRSADQVTIQPDGKWELHTKKETSVPARTNGVASDSDDDLVEITKSGDSVRTSTPQMFKTPSSALAGRSREQSTASAPPTQSGSTSGKRPIAAVIDLTSSGDEDEEPIARAPKRQLTNGYGTPSNVPVYRPGPSNGYTPH